MSSCIQIDAFDDTLFNSKILCHVPSSDTMPDIFEYIKNIREPFSKKILICSSSVIIKDDFNAVFHPRDIQDWSFVATFITHCLKPLLLVVEDIDIPETIWQKIGGKGITLVHIKSKLSSTDSSYHHYNTFFFGNPEEPSLFPFLKNTLKNEYTSEEHAQLVKELCREHAGIVFHKHSLYWYEPLRSHQYFSKQQLTYIFKTLSTQFS